MQAAADAGVKQFVFISVHDYKAPSAVKKVGYFDGKRRTEKVVGELFGEKVKVHDYFEFRTKEWLPYATRGPLQARMFCGEIVSRHQPPNALSLLVCGSLSLRCSLKKSDRATKSQIETATDTLPLLTHLACFQEKVKSARLSFFSAPSVRPTVFYF